MRDGNKFGIKVGLIAQQRRRLPPVSSPRAAPPLLELLLNALKLGVVKVGGGLFGAFAFRFTALLPAVAFFKRRNLDIKRKEHTARSKLCQER